MQVKIIGLIIVILSYYTCLFLAPPPLGVSHSKLLAVVELIRVQSQAGPCVIKDPPVSPQLPPKALTDSNRTQ